MDGEIENNEDMARICLIGSLGQDRSVLQAAETFGVSVLTSDTGQEFINDEAYITYFVINEFEGRCFDVLYEMKCRILGPTALKELAQNSEPLPLSDRLRPTYSLAMRGVVICFTGFRKKEDVCRLAGYVHSMNGSIRKEMDRKVTHLIANSLGGEKYKYATTFNIPIMSESWVTTAWNNRHVVGYSCKNSNIITENKLKFGGAKVSFMGFSVEETEHMSQILVSNKGILSSLDDPECTHLVVDETSIFNMPESIPPRSRHQELFIVKAEWFWASVQNEQCENEGEYAYEDISEAVLSPDKKRYQSTPISGSASTRARKRKRLQPKATLCQYESPLSHKRRSSISDAGLLSISGSYLDCTVTPEKDLCDEVEGTTGPGTNASGRYQVFTELVQTEANYVGILETIIKLFKTPLEDMVESDDVILNATEVKIIFGNLPPVHEIHKGMLEELRWGIHNWREDFSIGNVILKYAPELEKAYPPFINYFEKIKETLEECDINKPRFHAFLKVRQTKPECGRQSLKELLIRPVQRLPSISLLLNDLLKQTDKQNPDHCALEQALVCIKQAMTHINEDKRKTEAQLAMFDLFNEIENCPPHLISSHRSLIAKCECMELTEIVSSKKGDVLVFLLFTDTLEVCKKRARSFNTFRNTKPSSLQKVNKLKKQYKHVRLMPLSNLRKVIDIKESEECQNVFALLCRSQTQKDSLCSFTITDDSVDKQTFLKQMCKQMAHTVCIPDPDDFYDVMDQNEINVDTASNVSIRSTHSFSKALRFASKTGVKVGRALSMSKTPNKIIRAVSTVRPFVGQETLTRNANQLAQMRLQSCANLNELHCTPPRDFNGPVTPMSVQPTRRNMLASAFSVSSLKLL